MQLDRPRSISIAVEGEQFLSELLNEGCSQLTFETYGDRLRWLDEWLKSTDTPLSAVIYETAQAWISEQRARGWAPKMIRDNVSVMRGLFKWMERRGKIAADPLRHLKPIKVPKHLPEILQPADAQLVLEAAARMRTLDRAMVELFYGCMIRTGTLCALDVHDIDIRGLIARIRNKGNKERYVPLNPSAAAAVAAWLPDRVRILTSDSRRAQAAAMKSTGMSYREIGAAMGIAPCIAAQYVTKWKKNPPKAPVSTQALFVTKNGRVGPEYVREVIRKVAEAAGLDRRVYPHLFRHSGATHMHDAGADLKDVQEMLGHEDISTTTIYTHTSIAKLRSVYDRTHPRAGPAGSYNAPMSAAFPPPAVCPACGHGGHWGECKWTSRAPAPLETCRCEISAPEIRRAEEGQLKLFGDGPKR